MVLPERGEGQDKDSGLWWMKLSGACGGLAGLRCCGIYGSFGMASTVELIPTPCLSGLADGLPNQHLGFASLEFPLRYMYNEDTLTYNVDLPWFGSCVILSNSAL